MTDRHPLGRDTHRDKRFAKVGPRAVLTSALPPVLQFGLCICILLWSTGCGTERQTANGAWERDFELAMREATSDFERGALADGEISRAEYEEAVSRYVECANGAGLVVTPIPIGGYYNYEVTGPTNDDVMSSCGKGTTRLIESLYVGMLTNPNQVDYHELMVQCFRDAGLVGPEYSADDYRNLGVVVDGNGASTPGTGSLPFDDTDPRFTACLVNPSAR